MLEQRRVDYAVLLLRFSLGAMWISHALLKVLVFSISGFERFLTSHGMPEALALPVIMAELIGGVLIVLGFYGRWASIFLLPVLAGATAVHLANGWVFSNPQGGWEYPVFLLAMSLVHALLGDGAFAFKLQAHAAKEKMRTV